jgi:endonuclease/exonuclease/phosphatase (EEP) superfamily protein YafD
MLVLAAANLGLLLVVAGAMTSFSDVVAPLTGHLIGIGLAASLALVIRRQMLLLMALGTAATFALHAWLGLAGCCRVSATIAQTSLTEVDLQAPRPGFSVLALNTWRNGGEHKRVASYLATVAPDLVVLSQLGAARRQLLDHLKHLYPYQVECAQDRPCGLALLSRIPFESSGSARIGPDKPAFLWARLPGSLTVIGTHLPRPSSNPRLHAQHMAALAQFLRRLDGPIILAGDLNTSPWSSSYRTLRRATGLIPTSTLLPSWPAKPIALPQMALDHIFISLELAVMAAGAGPAIGTDHLPVWARLERRPFFDQRHSLPSGLASGAAAPGFHLGGELFAHLGGEHAGARDLRR